MQFLQTVLLEYITSRYTVIVLLNYIISLLGTDSFLLTFVHDKCYVLGLSRMVFAMDSYNYNSGARNQHMTGSVYEFHIHRAYNIYGSTDWSFEFSINLAQSKQRGILDTIILSILIYYSIIIIIILIYHRIVIH